MMPTGAEVAGSGEGSSSFQNRFNAESSDSSDVDDPVLAHDRERALLNDDLLEDSSNNPSVLTLDSPCCADMSTLGYLSRESKSCQAGSRCPNFSYHCLVRVVPRPTIHPFPPLEYVGCGNNLHETLPMYRYLSAMATLQGRVM